MNFNNLRVSTRLAAAFAVLMTMLLAVTATAWFEMNTMRRSSQDVATNWLPSVEHVSAIESHVHALHAAELQHVLNTDDAAMKRIEGKIGKIRTDLEAERAAYVKLISSSKEQALYDTFAADLKTYLQLHERLLELSRKNQNVQARDLADGESARVFARMATALEALVKLNTEGATAAAAESDAAFVNGRNILLGAALMAAVLALAAAVLIIRSITRPLNQAVDLSNRVAQGDLTTRIDNTRKDELGQLLAALQSMQDSLVHTVGTVRGNAESVATASAQIAQGNLDLSQRTEKQASALQETAASMEQLGSTVKLNADNAQRANALSQDAASIASRGGTVVQQVVERMKGINESSRRIENITSVIDGIAFQTNILALNAAVEAARAGEQGRGFAVVASEVRTLAQRSAEAAREIKGLIASSVQQVEQGSGLVAEAGQTMDEIMQAIHKVSTLVSEISAASAEQSAGVNQVGEAMSQMDQTTQQNAALVEQSAAAADSLRHQAGALVEAVAAFRLQDQAASGHAGAGLPAAANADTLKPVSAVDALPVRPVARPVPPAASVTRPAPDRAPAPRATGTDDWESF